MLALRPFTKQSFLSLFLSVLFCLIIKRIVKLRYPFFLYNNEDLLLTWKDLFSPFYCLALFPFLSAGELWWTWGATTGWEVQPPWRSCPLKWEGLCFAFVFGELGKEIPEVQLDQWKRKISVQLQITEASETWKRTFPLCSHTEKYSTSTLASEAKAMGFSDALVTCSSDD